MRKLTNRRTRAAQYSHREVDHILGTSTSKTSLTTDNLRRELRERIALAWYRGYAAGIKEALK